MAIKLSPPTLQLWGNNVGFEGDGGAQRHFLVHLKNYDYYENI